MTKKEILEMTGLSEKEFYRQYPTEESWTESYKKGGWIQKATASIKRRGTEGVCTGSKFGGPTCRPGTKRYNLAKTFRKMAKSRKEEGGYVDMYEEGGKIPDSVLRSRLESHMSPAEAQDYIDSYGEGGMVDVYQLMGMPTPEMYAMGGDVMMEDYARGGMIKRKDGSYSRRGLWDNIRANRGSGKKPTAEMLKQERKIRAAEKKEYGGMVNMYEEGGDTVAESSSTAGAQAQARFMYDKAMQMPNRGMIYATPDAVNPNDYALATMSGYTGSDPRMVKQAADRTKKQVAPMAAGIAGAPLLSSSMATVGNLLARPFINTPGLSWLNANKVLDAHMLHAFADRAPEWTAAFEKAYASGSEKDLKELAKITTLQAIDVSPVLEIGHLKSAPAAMKKIVDTLSPFAKTSKLFTESKSSAKVVEHGLKEGTKHQADTTEKKAMGGPVMYGMGGTTNIGDLSHVISAKNFPNMGYAMGGPVQYGLGSFVKKAAKSVSSAVKDVTGDVANKVSNVAGKVGDVYQDVGNFAQKNIKSAGLAVSKPALKFAGNALQDVGQFSKKLTTDAVRNVDRVKDRAFKNFDLKSTLKDIGATAYGLGEGLLDTVTMGATDKLTDMGYKGLQKLGRSSEAEIRQQDSLRGYGNTGGAIGGGILNPGAIGAAIGEGAEGLGEGVGKGSPDSKFAQGVERYAPVIGNLASMAYGALGSAPTGEAAEQANQFANSGFGKFAMGAAKFGKGFDKFGAPLLGALLGGGQQPQGQPQQGGMNQGMFDFSSMGMPFGGFGGFGGFGNFGGFGGTEIPPFAASAGSGDGGFGQLLGGGGGGDAFTQGLYGFLQGSPLRAMGGAVNAPNMMQYANGGITPTMSNTINQMNSSNTVTSTNVPTMFQRMAGLQTPRTRSQGDIRNRLLASRMRRNPLTNTNFAMGGNTGTTTGELENGEALNVYKNGGWQQTTLYDSPGMGSHNADGTSNPEQNVTLPLGASIAPKGVFRKEDNLAELTYDNLLKEALHGKKHKGIMFPGRIELAKRKKEALEEQAAGKAMNRIMAKYGGAVRRMYAKGGMVPMYDEGSTVMGPFLEYSVNPNAPAGYVPGTYEDITYGGYGDNRSGGDWLSTLGKSLPSLLGVAGMAAPAIWNFKQGNKAPSQVPTTLGDVPLEAKLKAPKYETEESLRKIKEAGKGALYAWKEAGAPGDIGTFTSIANKRMQNIADFEEKTRNAEKEMAFKVAAQNEAYKQANQLANAQQAMRRYMLQAQANKVPGEYKAAGMDQVGNLGKTLLNFGMSQALGSSGGGMTDFLTGLFGSKTQG